MSGASLESARFAASSGILRRFGAALEGAERDVEHRGVDAAHRKQSAARIALEYAVMRTALEKGVATPVVADALQGASVEQQATLIREGRAAMERAYGNSPEVIASALAGKIVEVPLPKGLASNPEFDRLIDSARAIVTTVVQESYSTRGRLDASGPRSDVVDSLAHSRTSAARQELGAKLAFLESAIDAAAERGQLGKEATQMLKDRVEAFVFQPRPPQSLKYTPEFTKFYETEGRQMRGEVMREVRAVTQTDTIREIGAKVDRYFPPRDRPQPELER